MGMKKFLPVILAVIVLAFGGLGFWLYSQNNNQVNNDTNSSSQPVVSDDKLNPQTTTTPAQQENVNQQSATPGTYVSYDEFQSNKDKYANNKVVYFFNAKWCPTCKVLNEDLNKSSQNIPAGITIVSIDYDNYSDLKKQYGVTIQHTLVQVDSNGNQIKKWSGGNNLESILNKI
jgi:thiol-disulfide isomerase/thioredoxin